MTVDQMADEVSEFKQWKYVADDATYDVSLLSEEAQGAFNMLLELNARKQVMQNDVAKLEKEVSIIVAASQAFNSIVNSLLTKDAIIDIDIDEPVLPDEDDEGERPDHDWTVD